MASTDKVLLDVNAIMELHFGRRSWRDVLAAIAEDGEEAEHLVSILSVHILLHFVEKDKRSKTEAFNFLQSYGIFDMAEADYEWAMLNDQGDFEDALQVACALRHGCKKLITLDADLSKRHNKHIVVKLVR
jgi:predicted nucleic acid-binding protein